MSNGSVEQTNDMTRWHASRYDKTIDRGHYSLNTGTRMVFAKLLKGDNVLDSYTDNVEEICGGSHISIKYHGGIGGRVMAVHGSEYARKVLFKKQFTICFGLPQLVRLLLNSYTFPLSIALLLF